jgi:hypothetical protein
MSNDAAFVGKVVDHKFVPDDLERWRRTLRSREGKRTRITVGAERKHRSNTQLDYYWAAIVRPFAQWCGEMTAAGEQAVHESLLREVMVPMLPQRFLIPTPSGEPLQGPGSTKVLTVDEMNEYIAKCRLWIFERFGFTTPDIDHVFIRR